MKLCVDDEPDVPCGCNNRRNCACGCLHLSDSIHADMPQLMALYRDLHANPEPSMQEIRTAAKLAPEMKKLGFQVTEDVGKTGVVAVMKNGPGPVLKNAWADLLEGVAELAARTGD